MTTTLDPELQAAAEEAINNGQLGDRPDGVARGDREQDRRGAGDGRRQRLRRAAVQPGHQRPPPARLGVQAVHPGRGAAEGHRPELGVHVAPEGVHGARPGGKEKFKVATTRTATSGLDRCARPPRLGQLGVRGARLQGRGHRSASPGWRERMGIRTKVSTNPAMTLGGLKEGVTPLEMALRLLDDRQPRQAGERHLAAPSRVAGGDRQGQRRTATQGDRRDQQEAEDPRSYPAKTARRPGDAHRARVSSGTATSAQIGGTFVGGQDRHDRELRRRLVRRLHRQAHRRGLGRLPRQAQADEDRVQRPAGGGRHLPGPDLARLHGAGDRDRRAPPRAEGQGGHDDARPSPPLAHAGPAAVPRRPRPSPTPEQPPGRAERPPPRRPPPSRTPRPRRRRRRSRPGAEPRSAPGASDSAAEAAARGAAARAPPGAAPHRRRPRPRDVRLPRRRSARAGRPPW